VRAAHAGGHIGERGEGLLPPKRLPAGLAFRRRSFGDGVRAGKGIDDGSAMSHLEMKMRKFRVAREPDPTEALTRLDELARAHGDAAFAQVRVLRFPAVAVIDYDRVARFPAGDGRAAGRSRARVLNAVAHRPHAPGCGREHAHPL